MLENAFWRMMIQMIHKVRTNFSVSWPTKTRKHVYGLLQNFTNILSNTAWRRCALDLVCAANTIRSYINRFGKVITIFLTEGFLVSRFSLQDCNGDQLVTCEDYVMIHKNGGWNCGKSLAGSKFFEIFQTCKEVVISRGLNI